MPTKHELVMAAKRKALIRHYINNLTEPTQARHIYNALQDQLQDTSRAAVLKLIEVLGKNGEVDARKEGNRTAYFRKGGNGTHAVVEVTPIESDAEPVATRGKKLKHLIETLTISEARILYAQLAQLFGKK
jgi:Fe2+ or Zn2+ uptake regulation protein